MTRLRNPCTSTKMAPALRSNPLSASPAQSDSPVRRPGTVATIRPLSPPKRRKRGPRLARDRHRAPGQCRVLLRINIHLEERFGRSRQFDALLNISAHHMALGTVAHILMVAPYRTPFKNARESRLDPDRRPCGGDSELSSPRRAIGLGAYVDVKRVFDTVSPTPT